MSILQKASGNISSSEIDNGESETGRVEKHRRMYKDSSISAPYSTDPMRIPKTLKIAKEHESMECVCSYTGIVIQIEVPKILGYAFEYQNPLSIYSNVKGMLQQGTSYLKALDTQVLAGIFITAYRHYDLIEAYSPKAKISGAAMNAMLRTAGKNLLLEALDFISLVNSRNCHSLPSLSLEYNAHKHAVNMAPALKEYIKLLRGILFPHLIPAKDKALQATVSEEELRITERNDAGIERRGSGTIKAYAGTERRSLKMSLEEQAFEERFKKNRARAKAILSSMEDDMLFSPKFLAALRSIIKGRNLVLMSSSFRKQFIEKLGTKQNPLCEEMAAIIKDSEDPTDIFGEIDEELESKPETKEAIGSTVSSGEQTAPTGKKMTIQEKLAAIKARKANGETALRDSKDNTEDNGEF